MELRYKISSRVMTIHADVFFLEAGRRKVRKLLTDYRASDPEASETGALKAWLEEKTESCRKGVAHIRIRLFEKEPELQEWKRSCELRRNVFEGREHLEEAKAALKACRLEVHELSSDLKKAERDMRAYQRSLEDMENIFGFGEELE